MTNSSVEQETILTRRAKIALICVATGTLLLFAYPLHADDDVVPKTVEGGAGKVKEGGHEIGEGFKGIGRGIKKVFKGERSKEDFEQGAEIGTGFKDLGVGTAGVGRGVGRGVRDGFQNKDGDSSAGPTPPSEHKLQEEDTTNEHEQ